MEQYQLVIAEKPSVAQALAAVLGAKKKQDGYLEGNGWLVSWCVGHLVELAQPEAYDEKYAKYGVIGTFPAFRAANRAARRKIAERGDEIPAIRAINATY